jgi:hypothetical protein
MNGIYVDAESVTLFLYFRFTLRVLGAKMGIIGY